MAGATTSAQRDGFTIERSPLLTALGVPHAFTATLPEADRPALLSAAGLPPRLVMARQVHGAGVLDADAADEGEADAVTTARPGVTVAVGTADCVPVLLAAPDGSRVAAVHAGWRGLLAGVIAAAVARFAAPPIAAIGPCIGVAKYETGRDLAARFGVDGDRLDLRRIAADQLHALGVRQIDVSPTCTFASPGHPSYRRDGVARPNMLSAIAVGA